MANSIDFSTVRVVNWDIDGTMYALPALMSIQRDLLRRMPSRTLSLRGEISFDCCDSSDTWTGSVKARWIPSPNRPGRDTIAAQAEMYGRVLPHIRVQPGVLELMNWFEEKLSLKLHSRTIDRVKS